MTAQKTAKSLAPITVRVRRTTGFRVSADLKCYTLRPTVTFFRELRFGEMSRIHQHLLLVGCLSTSHRTFMNTQITNRTLSVRTTVSLSIYKRLNAHGVQRGLNNVFPLIEAPASIRTTRFTDEHDIIQNTKILGFIFITAKRNTR